MAKGDSSRISQTREFVGAATLLAEPRGRRETLDAASGGAALQAGRQQAAVVGSDVLSFAAGVDSPWRRDLVNSSMLVQLVAKKKVPDGARLFDWYDTYFDVLSHIGWAVQDKSFAVYVEQSQDFQAHQAILQVACALLSTTTAGLALVKATLQALQSMDANGPWITLFNRESQSAGSARFQVSVAERTPGGELVVLQMAFGLQARTTLTQVLFFKNHASEITLHHSSARVGIGTAVLAGVRDGLEAKLVGFANDFFKTLPDL